MFVVPFAVEILMTSRPGNTDISRSAINRRQSFAATGAGLVAAAAPAATKAASAAGRSGVNLWKSVVTAYMEVGYEGMLSIENEDPILSGEVGVERAAYVLKNVRSELLGA